MLILASAVLGYLTNWWWFPAAAGMVGQAVHFAGSPRYRTQLQFPGALAAAFIATAMLTAGCLLAFAAGRWVAEFR